MKIRRAVFAVSASIVVAVVLLGGIFCVIDAEGAKSSDSAVLAKLDAMLDSQKSITDDLAAIKEDLRIIKIRITQAQ
ncbi:MAG: hypothetical protein KKH77_02170 [Candidatus Omnitrophica bacterium]|nr:hypothetical protein [Candidatus Omnitrophota bacterium]MBU0895132.1 hypothetical protein [Candidatus Omnitrophota bacterium]MBU1038091.1 hypothetical protein [Candidatus Omnitrophota bacterium]MBU1808207.1 hypothetical protein [Candidatus Omnitrophota bacterium]